MRLVFLCLVSVLAEQVWDPLSSSQTAGLVGFIRRLMKGYPTVLHGDNSYTQVDHLLFCVTHVVPNMLSQHSMLSVRVPSGRTVIVLNSVF